MRNSGDGASATDSLLLGVMPIQYGVCMYDTVYQVIMYVPGTSAVYIREATCDRPHIILLVL